MNKNLNQRPVSVAASHPIDGTQCEVSLPNFKAALSSVQYCSVKSLSGTFNFSIVNDIASESETAIYHFGLDCYLYQDSFADITQVEVMVPYSVKHDIVKFAYVAPLPTASEGLTLFLSPFTCAVWVSLIGCCLGITLIIGCSAKSDAGTQNVKELTTSFIGHNFVFRLKFLPENPNLVTFFKFNANIYFYLTNSHDLYELCYFCVTSLIQVKGTLSKNYVNRKRPLNFNGWPIHTEGKPSELCKVEFRFENCHFTYRFYAAAQRKFNFSYIKDFLNVSSILVGQVNGDSFTMFHNKEGVAMPILIVWFFGAGFIIMNNLYMGSIFSYLSAIPLPIFPPSWKLLVDSEIPIITTSSITSTTTFLLDTSLLKDSLIPDYITLFEHKPNLVKKFHQLNNKVAYLNFGLDKTVMANFLHSIKTPKKMSKSGNQAVPRGNTFATMDDANYVMQLAKLFQWYGTRLVILGTEDAPFSDISFGLASRTYLFTLFQKRFGELLSFGFEKRWTKLESTYTSMNMQFEVDNTTYQKYFARVVASIREPITFNESDPVSLKSVQEVFALCGVVLFVSFITLLIDIDEGKVMRYLCNWISFLKIANHKFFTYHKNSYSRRRSNRGLLTRIGI